MKRCNVAGCLWAIHRMVGVCVHQLDVALSDYLKRSFGYMATESVTCNALSWLAFTVTAGYFHTDDFASRLYVYERGPLYSFSFPAYYGRGLHGSLFARTDLSRRLMLILRTSFTHYFDRDHISSGSSANQFFHYE